MLILLILTSYIHNTYRRQEQQVKLGPHFDANIRRVQLKLEWDVLVLTIIEILILLNVHRLI